MWSTYADSKCRNSVAQCEQNLSKLCSLVPESSLNLFIQRICHSLNQESIVDASELSTLLALIKVKKPNEDLKILLFKSCLSYLNKVCDDTPTVFCIVEEVCVESQLDLGLDLVLTLLRNDVGKGLNLFGALGGVLRTKTFLPEVKRVLMIICDVFIDIIYSSSIDFARQALSHCPVLIESLEDGVVDKLCSETLQRTENNDDLERGLLLIASLSKYLLKTSNDLIEELAFKGLISKQISVRKNALSVLKMLSPSEKFIVIYETLEESQVHLVMPSVRNLDSIADPKWLFVLYVRLLSHDSLTVNRFGISNFLSRFDFDYDSSLLSHLFSSLNNTLLFQDSATCELLRKWFTFLIESRPQVFLSALNTLCRARWSTVPLFHIVDALSCAPEASLIHLDALSWVANSIKCCASAQNIMIRAAIQSKWLISVVNLSSAQLPLCSVSKFLSVFSSKECLKRGTESWCRAVQWVQRVVSNEDVANYMNHMGSDSAVESTLILVLLYDSQLLSEDQIRDFLLVLCDVFVDCDKRPYSCLKTQNNALEFLLHLLKQWQFYDDRPNDSISLFNLFVPNIITFLGFRLQNNSQIYETGDVNIYISLLELLLINFRSSRTGRDHFIKLYRSSMDILKRRNTISIKELLALKILHVYASNGWFETGNTLGSDLVPLLKDMIISKSLIQSEMMLMTDGTNKIGCVLISECITSVWRILCFYVKTLDREAVGETLHSFGMRVFYEEAMEALRTGDRYVSSVILDLYDQFISDFPEDAINGILSCTWTCCFELRKSELFWLGIKKWMRTSFSNGLLHREDGKSIALEYGQEILSLSESIPGLANLLSQQLQTVCDSVDLSPFCEIIVELLIFGPLMRRDQRIEAETCRFVRSLSQDCSINVLAPNLNTKWDVEVRLRALDIVVSSRNTRRHQLIPLIVKKLIDLDTEAFSKNKRRYFNDSIVHRRKHRSLQTILLLDNHFSGDIAINTTYSKVVFDWIVKNLFASNHQPSVRYQLEWLYVRLSLRFPHLKSTFWAKFEQASLERPASLSSFISIGYHLAKSNKDNEFFERLLENLIPCCMSQNFTIRLYSQVVIEKLLPLYSEVSEKYDMFFKNQSKIFDQGNMVHNAKKLRTDFYFESFDPVQHFTVKTIFWDLPRLSNISRDEWVDVDVFQKYMTNWPESLSGIELVGENESLAEYSTPSWIVKAVDSKEDVMDGDGCVLQKKFVPDQLVNEYSEISSGPSEESQIKSSKFGELILVASLVSKTTNLGGLARTANVLGVSELVLDSLSVIKDKNFTGLSMTSEKHLRLIEVKSYHLPYYLTQMKRSGYTIVGAEQTTESQSLFKFEFPIKTVLVLGNEREGIAPELLNLLDHFVEIPQFGVIRSLNVHVSGAILIWEYAKAHLAK